MSRPDLSKIEALAALVRVLCRVPPLRASQALERELPAALVRRHSLAPLAYQAGCASFRGDFIAASLMVELRERILAEAIEALTRARVPVILLKGISYLGTIYDVAAERPMSDIDLLVPDAQHHAAARALRRLGYWAAGSEKQRSPYHHAMAFKRRSAAIDLHRSIMQPWRSRIDLAALWQRARPARERQDGVLRLDPVDEAVFHLGHMARHELRVPLINYVDAIRLLRRIPGRSNARRERVLARAQSFRLGRAARAALAMTDALQSGVAARRSILPSSREILSHRPPPRLVQLLRKALLVEGARELVGLALVDGYGRLVHRVRR